MQKALAEIPTKYLKTELIKLVIISGTQRTINELRNHINN